MFRQYYPIQNFYFLLFLFLLDPVLHFSLHKLINWSVVGELNTLDYYSVQIHIRDG